ncbi:MAG: hypothetical protein ACQXXJ_03020, partial [Candidatus Bathyarchaeia archaeon]
YLFSSEHSPNSPLYKGEKIRCINAYTGEELWVISGWGQSGNFYSANGAIADGYYAYLNSYDQQIYCIGRGPTKTTVSAPQTAVPAGTPVLITGTVTDQTPSKEAKDTPAISDESMGAWMEYLYMQKPRPTDAKGVQVKLVAYNENGNAISIGTATTDIYGNYGLAWTPPTEGTYQIIATFETTNSYWGSENSAYLSVCPAVAQPTIPSTPTPAPTQAPTSTATPATPSPSTIAEPDAKAPTDTLLIIGAAIVIIIVIAVVAMLLRKRT